MNRHFSILFALFTSLTLVACGDVPSDNDTYEDQIQPNDAYADTGRDDSVGPTDLGTDTNTNPCHPECAEYRAGYCCDKDCSCWSILDTFEDTNQLPPVCENGICCTNEDQYLVDHWCWEEGNEEDKWERCWTNDNCDDGLTCTVDTHKCVSATVLSDFDELWCPNETACWKCVTGPEEGLYFTLTLVGWNEEAETIVAMGLVDEKTLTFKLVGGNITLLSVTLKSGKECTEFEYDNDHHRISYTSYDAPWIFEQTD